MLSITHVTIGALSTCLALQTANPAVIGIGAVASLLPDVDTSISLAGRAMPWLSNRLERSGPHRSCTHSVVASLAVAIATYVPVFALAIYAPAIWANLPLSPIHAINIGYFMGWYADSFTKNGVEMFWPDRTRWVIPANRKYRLATGSPAELTVLAILVAVALVIFGINFNGGMVHEFNRMLATSSGVLEVYNRTGGNHLVTVHIKGVRESDRTAVTGDYWLIRPHGKNFIVQSKMTGKIYQAGTNETDCQILVQQITAEPGVNATTNVESIKLDLDSVSSKLQSFNRPRTMVFVSGELSLDNAEVLSHLVTDPYEFHTIKGEVGKVILDTAPLQLVVNQLGDELGTGYLSIRSTYVQS